MDLAILLTVLGIVIAVIIGVVQIRLQKIQIDQDKSKQDGQAIRLAHLPNLPINYIEIGENLNSLKTIVLKARQESAHFFEKKVCVYGMAGIGKTVLSKVLAHDHEIQKIFHDGVIWLSIGRSADLLERQTQAIFEITGKSTDKPGNTQIGFSLLADAVSDKNILIILDDIWNEVQFNAFDCINEYIGKNSVLLFSTTVKDFHEGRAGSLFVLPPPNETQALNLLAIWAGQNVADLPPIAKQIVEKCGKLPLALAMVGATVKKKRLAWEYALHRLQQANLEKIAGEVGYQHRNLAGAFEVSVETLTHDDRERFRDLAVFSEDILIPIDILKIYWESLSKDEHDIDDILDNLSELTLIQREATGDVIMHNIVHLYLRGEFRDKPDDLTRRHSRVVDAFAKKCPDGWASWQGDKYYFLYLPYHLTQAKWDLELKSLLLDFKWIYTKLMETDIGSVIADYDFVSESEPHKLVRDTLSACASVLQDDKNQLAFQLLGRLKKGQSEAIDKFLYDARIGTEQRK